MAYLSFLFLFLKTFFSVTQKELDEYILQMRLIFQKFYLFICFFCISWSISPSLSQPYTQDWSVFSVLGAWTASLHCLLFKMLNSEHLEFIMFLIISFRFHLHFCLCLFCWYNTNKLNIWRYLVNSRVTTRPVQPDGGDWSKAKLSA